MGGHVNYAGLVIAGLGFFLTRFTVTLAVYETTVNFYLAGVVPLALGLGLAAFGVALTVADVDAAVVRTTTIWCLIGTASMLVLVVLTLIGSTPGVMLDLSTVRSRTYLTNFLIGGSVGGTLTGLYASRNRRQRAALREQTNRLEVLNRLLRHEVLNAVTVIRGYAREAEDLESNSDTDAGAVIDTYSSTIEDAIEDVKYLTRDADAPGGTTAPMSIRSVLASARDRVRDRHPHAAIAIETPAPPPLVLADQDLEEVFVHLLDNAIVHAEADGPAAEGDAPAVEADPQSVEVAVATANGRVRVSVRDDGPGLPERQRELLERGAINEFDDPGAGFGLNFVRLLVARYDGAIETAVDDEGSTVTVVLPRAPPGAETAADTTAVTETASETQSASGAGNANGDAADSAADASGSTDADADRPVARRSRLADVRPRAPQLVVVFAAALLAGVAYGAASEAMGGSIAFIGVYYGVESPVVGWITHEFHSVVFGFVFAGLLSLAPLHDEHPILTYLGVGVAWGVVLWFLAAGVVSPVWLGLLGLDVAIPNLTVTLLVNHVVWGLAIAVLTAVGYARLTGPIERAWRGLERRVR